MLKIPQPIRTSQLRLSFLDAALDFNNTCDIPSLPTVLGHERALSAIQFGIDMTHQGYNIFVMGPSGLGKHKIIKDFLNKQKKNKDTPSDWCYIHNFKDEQKPKRLELPAGKGIELQRDMKRLINELTKAITEAFESKEYQDRIQEINKQTAKQQDELIDIYAQQAEQMSIHLAENATGYTLMPMLDGQVLSEADFESLSDEEKLDFNAKMEAIQEQLEQLAPDISRLRRENENHRKELNRQVALFATSHLIKEIRKYYNQYENVEDYLENLQEDVLDNLEDFTELLADKTPEPNAMSEALGMEKATPTPVTALERYQVNVLVNNLEREGAPVIYEDNPSYHNLIGRIEYESVMGSQMTDFTLIRPGKLLEANGGYLILDARKLLEQNYSWDALKRTLYSHKLKIEAPERMLSNDNSISLTPEPIPIDVKIILMGDREIYYNLYNYDPDFHELFRVEADFDEEISNTRENLNQYTRLLVTIAREKKLGELTKAGILRLFEFSARLAENSTKLSIRLQILEDLLIESSYWKQKKGDTFIDASHVQNAIDEQRKRTSRIHDLVQDDIQEGVVLIDTQGSKIGQVNGLSVFEIGKYGFGQPSRITATVHKGDGQIINIEREADLSGSIHDKGVLILSALLASRYCKNHDLSISASIAFEQSYGYVDGDSASVAELSALISALTHIPIKQNFALTGSLNQRGEIQAIGGVNEKIEGFFDICKTRGLTGDQGCIIPAINERNLVLRNDIIEAIANEQFFIYPVVHIDQVLTLLTGIDAGIINEQGEFPEGSINYKVQAALKGFALLDQKKKS